MAKNFSSRYTEAEIRCLRRLLGLLVSPSDNLMINMTLRDFILHVLATFPGFEALRAAGYSKFSDLDQDSWVHNVFDAIEDYLCYADKSINAEFAEFLTRYVNKSRTVTLWVPHDQSAHPEQTRKFDEWYSDAGFVSYKDFTVWLCDHVDGVLIDQGDFYLTFIVCEDAIEKVQELADRIGLAVCLVPSI